MDVRQDELGDLVDKEMAATSAAIEEAVRRIDVSSVNYTNIIFFKLISNSIPSVTDKMSHMLVNLGNDESGTKGHIRNETGG